MSRKERNKRRTAKHVKSIITNMMRNVWLFFLLIGFIGIIGAIGGMDLGKGIITGVLGICGCIILMILSFLFYDLAAFQEDSLIIRFLHRKEN